MSEVKFIDLQTQQDIVSDNIKQAIHRVLKHGRYVLGPEVLELEQELSKFCGSKHAISCANGTDALKLILMAKNIDCNSAVFVPSFTFAATAEVVKHLGAHPVFVDVLPDTFNIDPESLKQAIQVAKTQGLKLSAVIAVDLFGQPANYDAIEAIAHENNMFLLCDAAQSFGASYKGRKVGNIGLATSTSFYPSKPLGCYGDGGCIFTNDDELANIICSLRVNGRGQEQYEHIRIGINSRLDTIQAAIALEKLKIFPDEIKKRQEIAIKYNHFLHDIVSIPKVIEGADPIWALYTITLDAKQDRNLIQNELRNKGIPTAIYYPKSLHQQQAYLDCIKASDSLKNSELLSQKVLSLPLHPYLHVDNEYLDKITTTLK